MTNTKQNHTFIKSLLLITTILISSCTTKPNQQEVELSSVEGTIDEVDIISTNVDDGEIVVTDISIDKNTSTTPTTNTIYFEFEQSSLTPDSELVLFEHAKYLSQTDQNIIIEGHADERGTREFNLSLSENRGKTVAMFLQSLGINQTRYSIISFGEEKPVSLLPGEAGWKLNRRVEIVYQ